MKHTPVTDKYLNIIEDTLSRIKQFERDSQSIYYDKILIFITLKNTEANVKSIDLNEIKREFWEMCGDFDKIKPLKQIFQLKFEKLLSSRVCSIDDIGEYFGEYLEEKDLLIDRYESNGIKFTEEGKDEIERAYTSIMCDLATLKARIIELLNELEQMGTKANESNPNDTQAIEPNHPKFKLASKKKTDFIKLISAMYDNRMFETEDGYLASSKQELMNKFGSLLGEDLSNYSVLLSKSKNTDMAVFLKPFKEIEKKAEDYYNRET